MSGEIQRLIGSQNTSLGVSISGSTARKARREIEQLAARTDVVVMTEQASAFAHSVALSNMAALVSQAEAHMQSAPAGGEFYHAILANYAVSANQRLSRGL